MVVREYLHRGFYMVEEENAYIIGIIRRGISWPLNAPRVDLTMTEEELKYA